MLSESGALRDRLVANTRWFRRAMTESGFAIRPGDHPIVPIMLGDARLAQQVAADLLEHGIYVIGFSYPVVPQGQARIRVQVSAAHEQAHLERAVTAFVDVGRAHRVLSPWPVCARPCARPCFAPRRWPPRPASTSCSSPCCVSNPCVTSSV